MGNWFDVDVAITLGLLLFTTGLAVVSLESTYKPPTPQRVRRYRILTTIFALALIALTYVQATHTKRSDGKRDGELSQLQGKTDIMRDMLLHPNASDTDKQILIALNKLGTRLGIKQQPVPPERNIAEKSDKSPSERIVPVTALTTDELRAHALDWAAKMRTFDRMFREQRAQKEDSERQGQMANRGKSAEEQRALWQQQTNGMLSDYRQREQDFKQVYLGTAVALRDELINRYIRVGAVPPKPLRWNTVFENQALAGVDPIGEAATYLEQLARELPDK